MFAFETLFFPSCDGFLVGGIDTEFGFQQRRSASDEPLQPLCRARLTSTLLFSISAMLGIEWFVLLARTFGELLGGVLVSLLFPRWIRSFKFDESIFLIATNFHQFLGLGFADFVCFFDLIGHGLEFLVALSRISRLDENMRVACWIV